MIDVILPALNEAAALPSVLAGMPGGFRPIVVDNGSSDSSGAIARGLGAEVVHEPRRGFGWACWAGLEAATSEIVCFMDCDGSLDPRDLARVTAPVLDGAADLVVGERRPEAGAWPLHARAANRVLAAELRRRHGVRLRDPGPMRAARRDPLLLLELRDRRFGWPAEMLVRAAAAGWRIDAVPVAYRRRSGRSKVTGTVRGTVRAVTDTLAVLRGIEAAR